MLLRELYEAKARRVVAVMPGGFHPFHPGHKSLYDWAVKTFGQKNVYVAATNDTKARPFPFEVKKKLAAMAGVPESNFMQVKSPFNAMSYKDIVDADTALVFVRSQKDKNEQPLPDQTKKNGEPGYLRTYTGKALNTSDEMGYMAYGPTINFDFSGMQIKSASELRATWPEMSDEDKLKAAKLMYGNGAKAAVQLLDKALGGSVDEGDVIPFKKSNPANPHLDKDALDTWNKERNQKMAQDMIRLAPEIVEYYKELKDQNKDTETAIDIIAYDFDIDQYDVKRILQADNVDEDLEEAQTGDVYMRFKVRPPLDKNRGKPTLMAFAGFANNPSELTLDTSKMNFNVLNKKQDIVNAIKKVIGDKIFIGAEKVVIYNDGAVNPKKFPQYGEFLAWVDQFGKEKVKIVDKPESDNDVEKGPGKKRVKAKWANKKNYTDDNIETTKYFTIDNNRLMKFLQKSAPKIMQAYRPATKQFVMEPAQYKTFRNWMRSPEVVSKFGDTNVKVDKSKSFSQSVGKEFEQIEEDIPAVGVKEPEMAEDVSPEDEKKFHNELDDLVHKYFGDSPDEEKMKKKMKKTVEKAPPGREKQVKALKKKFDDPSAPYAIAWAQHNKKKK